MVLKLHELTKEYNCRCIILCTDFLLLASFLISFGRAKTPGEPHIAVKNRFYATTGIVLIQHPI